MAHRAALLVATGAVLMVPLVTTAQAPIEAVLGRPGRKGPLPPAGQPDFMEFNWIAGGGPTAWNDYTLTPEGKKRFDAYDFKTDDPSYKCVGSSWTRIYLNPNVLIHFTQGPDFIRMQYEWMDIDRRIPLSNPVGNTVQRVRIKGHPALGASAAWYEGDTLVIDTIDFAPGYVSTIAERAGLPQSTRMHTVERLRREGDVLLIETTHVDAANYQTPVVSTIRYRRTDWDLMDYGCDPQEAMVVSPR
ncbi:MAG: hypothetical protein AB7I50_11905 [Vicinamibacterales bacterium]